MCIFFSSLLLATLLFSVLIELVYLVLCYAFTFFLFLKLLPGLFSDGCHFENQRCLRNDLCQTKSSISLFPAWSSEPLPGCGWFWLLSVSVFPSHYSRFLSFFFFFRLISILYDYCQILASLWAPPCSNFWYEMCQNVDLWIVDSYLSFTGNITLVSLLCHCHWVYYSSYC